uniref:Uncharacterized protein LOC111129076 isoform X3 n=1 Tax=Crassostrea virginica TaxID=6565 RepID=A0A8B8DV47_CRAVI|nr:uncharacterized protein LOC111129076 isoform X3 [Crassostrea virginica]
MSAWVTIIRKAYPSSEMVTPHVSEIFSNRNKKQRYGHVMLRRTLSVRVYLRRESLRERFGLCRGLILSPLSPWIHMSDLCLNGLASIFLSSHFVFDKIITMGIIYNE